MPRSRPQRKSRARKQRRADPSDAHDAQGFSTREVAEALGLPTATILGWVRRGLIEPEKSRRGSYIFSFQDLVTLRTARTLVDADVPARRVHTALSALRTQLPPGRPLSAVSLSSVGSRVLVRDDEALWEPDSGQILFDLEEVVTAAAALPHGPRLALLRAEAPEESSAVERSADEWYDAAVDLEGDDPAAAMKAYSEALTLDARHSDAHLNLGRLYHEAGQLEAAKRHYLDAIQSDGRNARAHFNLGVVREDEGDEAGAGAAYEEALSADPALAVAHFNQSRLMERAGRGDAALRHLVEYRRLTERVETSSAE